VSLLLDALKRAEQEKLARGERPDLQIVGQPEAPQLAAARAAAAPATELELQPLALGPGAAGAKEKTAAQSAQAVFQAKASQGKEKPRRGLLLAAAAAIALAVIGAGAYMWFALQALAPAPVAARIAPPPVSVTPPAGAPPATAPVTAPAAKPAAVPAPAVAAALTAPAAQPPAPRDRTQIAAELLREPASLREPPLRLDRSQESARVPAEIGAAYDALRRGDYAAAKRGYQAAVAADSASLDANLGLATAEARAGNIAAASLFYRKALQLDPGNVTAIAGLAALADASRPGAVEARLREDLMRHPDSPALHLALGNVYATQKRWSEAQAEYFEAHRLDPANPDIAFNLAVSLDNLGRAGPAADFYRRALESSRAQPGQFDPASVTRRLAEMGS
jgi:Tfp pilus assembly protein PilF